MTTTQATAIEANAALGRQFFLEQDRLRGGPAPELCDPGYGAVIGGNPPTDRAGHEAFAVGFYAGFPDARHTIEEVVATDNHAVVRFVLDGTHTGNFFGIPATQRLMHVTGIAILDVADGRVHALRAVFDEAGLLRQIGVLPSS